MSSSGLIRLLQIPKGVGSGRPPRTTSSSGELAGAASTYEDMPRSHADGRYFGSSSVRTTDLPLRQPAGTGAQYRPAHWCNGARGGVCVSRGLTPNKSPTTDVKSDFKLLFQNPAGFTIDSILRE